METSPGAGRGCCWPAADRQLWTRSYADPTGGVHPHNGSRELRYSGTGTGGEDGSNVRLYCEGAIRRMTNQPAKTWPRNGFEPLIDYVSSFVHLNINLGSP